MEHLSLLAATTGSKDLAIGSKLLGNKLKVEAKQDSNFIDRLGHGDGVFSFGSWNSGNKTSVDFGQNADEKLELTHKYSSEYNVHILPGPGWATETSSIWSTGSLRGMAK